MAPHLQLIDLDLTDEQGLLARDAAEHDLAGTRSALAALNLRTHGAAATRDHGDRFDFAVYKATGDRHLASIFGRAA